MTNCLLFIFENRDQLTEQDKEYIKHYNETKSTYTDKPLTEIVQYNNDYIEDYIDELNTPQIPIVEEEQTTSTLLNSSGNSYFDNFNIDQSNIEQMLKPLISLTPPKPIKPIKIKDICKCQYTNVNYYLDHDMFPTNENFDREELLLSVSDNLDHFMKLLKLEYVDNTFDSKFTDEMIYNIIVMNCLYGTINTPNYNTYSDSYHFIQLYIFINMFDKEIYKYITKQEYKDKAIAFMNKLLNCVVTSYIRNDQHTIVDTNIDNLPEWFDKEYYYTEISRYYSMLSKRFIINNKQYIKEFIDKAKDFMNTDIYNDGKYSNIKFNIYLLERIINK